MEQLRQVGIRVRYSIGTIPEASAAFFGNEKKTDALVSAWTGRPDPSLTFSLMYLPDAYYNGGRGPVPAFVVFSDYTKVSLRNSAGLASLTCPN